MFREAFYGIKSASSTGDCDKEYSQTLIAEKEALLSQLACVKFELAQYKADNSTAQRIDQLNKTIDALETDNDELIQQLEQTEGELEELKEQNKGIREELDQEKEIRKEMGVEKAKVKEEKRKIEDELRMVRNEKEVKEIGDQEKR